MIENLNNWYVLIVGIFTGAGSFVGWVQMRKYNKEKDISQNRKETKINNVDGDAALINQLDSLLVKVTALSETVVRVQSELSDMKNKVSSYKSAIHRMFLLCDEVCKDADFCKGKIKSILKQLNLN